MEKAAALSRSCDVFLVIGSTLIVHPAASLPALAQQSGAFTAIINLYSHGFARVAHLRVSGQRGDMRDNLKGGLAQCIKTIQRGAPIRQLPSLTTQAWSRFIKLSELVLNGSRLRLRKLGLDAPPGKPSMARPCAERVGELRGLLDSACPGPACPESPCTCSLL